jgi:hypothetical protein
MKKIFSILQGITELHYHAVPGELESITLSPEREAIFKYLAQIGPDKFLEFIIDILFLVEKHKPIDITNGAGDEKQDILTLTPAGARHLTQCKHTINYKEHYSGDELDLLFGACARKNCTRGLFVTNSDLTTQGKRYITDKEFARGSQIPNEMLPDLDYWNGARIWERVATNNAILNKWFSGMGQAHGLRHFFFDLIIQKMPSGVSNSLRCVDIAKNLAPKYSTTELEENLLYEVKSSNEISFNISDWFHSDLDLGVPYVPPEREPPLVNIPLVAIRIQVTVAGQVGQYNPAKYRDSVVETIGNEALPELPDTEWWHFIATTPHTFVFLHDIVEPKLVPLSTAQSFVRVGVNPVEVEKNWVFPQGEEYKRTSKVEEDDLSWQHTPSGTDIILLLEQRIHPVAAYEHYMLQLQQVRSLQKCELFVTPKASESTIDKVRRLVDPRAIIMTSNTDDLLWALPPTFEAKKVEEIEETLKRQGIPVYHIPPKNKEKYLDMIEVPPPSVTSIINNAESKISAPIWLNRRLFWFDREVRIEKIKQEKTWLELLKFKAQYETHHGFDFMKGKKTTTMGSEEIRGFLYDMMSVRGDRMLDIGFHNDKMSINLRLRENSFKSTRSLLPIYIKELDDIISEVLHLLKMLEGAKG